jgi:hypothetical protein
MASTTTHLLTKAFRNFLPKGTSATRTYKAVNLNGLHLLRVTCKIKEGNTIIDFKREGLKANHPSADSIQTGDGKHFKHAANRYLTHDCKPSCAIAGDKLVATKDLKPGYQINIDFRSQIISEPFICACGHCEGTYITGKQQRSLTQQDIAEFKYRLYQGLRQIDLSNRGITYDMAKGLLQELRNYPNIHTLNLSNNPISKHEKQKLLEQASELELDLGFLIPEIVSRIAAVSKQLDTEAEPPAAAPAA